MMVRSKTTRDAAGSRLMILIERKHVMRNTLLARCTVGSRALAAWNVWQNTVPVQRLLHNEASQRLFARF
jgi:hypothetical protein